MGGLRKPACSSVPGEMYAVLSQQEGKTVGSSSVYTTAPELFAGLTMGSLTQERTPIAATSFTD